MGQSLTLKVSSYTYPASNFAEETQGPNAGPPANHYALTRTVTVTRTRDGVAVHDWKGKIARGENATSPLTGVWDNYSRSQVAGVWSYQTPDPDSWTKGSYAGNVCEADYDVARTAKPPIKSTAEAENGAAAKFYKQLRKEAVQFSGPTFLGELRQTLHMMRRPAAALWSKTNGYLDALSKAKRASPRAWTKEISGLWLEHSFGWLPLINDVKDAAKAWDTLVKPEKPRQKNISVGFSKEFDRTSELSSLENTALGSPRVALGGPLYWRKQAFLIEKHVLRIKGAIRAKTDATTWDNWALFGFTPSEFVPTAWELLPWSFLIDYFTNIGDILTSVVTDTSNIVYINRSLIQRTQYFGALRVDHAYSCNAKFGPTGIPSGTDSRSEWLIQRKLVSRGSISFVPLPRFQFTFDLTDGQLFNVAALLGQSRGLHPQNVAFRRWR